VSGIQVVRDPAGTPARRGLLEDLADNRGLGLIDSSFDVEPFRLSSHRVRQRHLDIVVTVHGTARDIPRSRLPHEGVVSALARLLAFHFIRKGRDREEELVRRALQGALPVLQVIEDAHTPAVMICFNAYAVSICSRPSRDSSDMMRTWNAGFGLSAFMSRRNPGRFTNSAPEMPSST
jgi:hypothetical protein